MFRQIAAFAGVLVCWQIAIAQCAGQYYYVQPSYQPVFAPAPQMYFDAQVVEQEAVTNAAPQSESHHQQAAKNIDQSPNRQAAFRQFVEQALSTADSANTSNASSAAATVPAKQVAFQQTYETIPEQPSEQYQPLAPAQLPTRPIPDCRQGALHILDYPGILGHIDCCPDNTTGNCDRDIKRFNSEQAARASCHDPNCVICVQEPYICEKLCYEEAEVVFFRCYEKCEPFTFARCEDQRCIQEVGKRTVKKLDPCTVKIKVPIRKLVIEYRKVWICINCPLPDCRPNPEPHYGADARSLDSTTASQATLPAFSTTATTAQLTSPDSAASRD